MTKLQKKSPEVIPGCFKTLQTWGRLMEVKLAPKILSDSKARPRRILGERHLFNVEQGATSVDKNDQKPVEKSHYNHAIHVYPFLRYHDSWWYMMERTPGDCSLEPWAFVTCFTIDANRWIYTWTNFRRSTAFAKCILMSVIDFSADISKNEHHVSSSWQFINHGLFTELQYDHAFYPGPKAYYDFGGRIFSSWRPR